MSSGKKSSERLIKKYPNRRLYDTQTSSYITLTDVKQLVLDADEFTVVDAKTNEDLTRSILLQIILEEEATARRCSRAACCRRSSATTATRCRA
jgi:polyhydroxyalkanoate synthesis repressor PhaR